MVSIASRRRMSAAAVCCDQLLLLAHVDRDADQVQARLVGVARDLAARPQPNPLAARMAHAEIMIDRFGLAVGELGRDLIELDVIGMNERVDLPERQQLVARVEPENREHRVRPEDTAARQVPVPQAAAAAIEGGVDAPAHHVVDHVGFARARRLPMECEAEDQHHEAGGRRQRHRERGIGARKGERRRTLLDHRELAERRIQRAHRGECLGAVGERYFEDAGRCPECGERLHRAERVEQWASERRGFRRAGDHEAVRVGDQELDTGVVRVLLIEWLDDALDAACELGLRGHAIVAVEALGQNVGGEVEVADDIGDRLAAMIIDLYQGADRHGEQEGNDQNRYGPP